MDLFDLFTLLGGLAFFLFGMSVMTNGLERLSHGKLDVTLKKLTSTPFKGLITGTLVTAALQSSSAVTVMLVGFVNSGVMTLHQCIGIIMGSNIGTTLTCWILGMAEIEGTNFVVRLFSPSSLAPLAALAGIMFIMSTKKSRTKDVGSVFMGFALLIYGMELMSSAAEPLTQAHWYANLVGLMKNPVIGLLAGTIITGIVQSSAATIGILQILSQSGTITYSMAIPIIMGQNIGTCVTALLAGIGMSKNARKVANVHINFNIWGTVIFLVAYYAIDLTFGLAFSQKSVDSFGIALIHTVFNIASAVILYPFMSLLEKIADIIIDGKKQNRKDLSP